MNKILKIGFVSFCIILLFSVSIFAVVGSLHAASEVWIHIQNQNVDEEMTLLNAFNQNVQSTAGRANCENSCLYGFDGLTPLCKPTVEPPEHETPGQAGIVRSGKCGKRCVVYSIVHAGE